MQQIILFNPKSAKHKHRIPNSILQIAASVHGKYEYVIVDGNLEVNPEKTILTYLETGKFSYFGLTVMPGPQLKQAVSISKSIRLQYPKVKIIWGGYFASNQYDVVLNSAYIDFVVNGPGDSCFPQLIDALIENKPIELIKNLIYRNQKNEIIQTTKESIPDQDLLADLPYDYLNSFYPLKNYFGKTFLGKRTTSYHSSMGCPFKCSFCAVVPIYEGRWKGKSAKNIYKDIRYLKEQFSIDSIEFHDNNFFTSRDRVVEFSKLIRDDKINWWGEGRIDTLNKYSDDDLALMRESGCRMIFFGAETGNDTVLAQMNKGGKQSSQMIKDFAGRLKKFDIIPEYSFVLGLPADSEELVWQQIEADIQFIKTIKEINPNTEIIIYLYSPVPTKGSDLYKLIIQSGFKFPEHLEDWLSPQWEKFDLRKNPLTPWLTADMVNKIRDFETVLNAYYPTVSDFRIKGIKKKLLRLISSFRYKRNIFYLPYEIKIFQKIWKYRQPEIEGFYME